MATERVARTGLPAAALTLLAGAATPLLAHAAPAWWQPLALNGQRVTSVSTADGTIVATTGSGVVASRDGGRTFEPYTPPAAGSTVSASNAWTLHNGIVVTPLGTRDPGAPDLGATAHLIAAPAALPGVVVAVGSDNHVWRRDARGTWTTSFVLLPAGGLSAPPRVTSLAAFDRPITTAVYMGTSGYGVLLSDDGGDDWIRADPGLPANVLALAADSGSRSLYAATDSGLYVHHLQAFPAPPTYQDSALALRWLGVAAVTLVATAAALLLLAWLLAGRRDRAVP